MTAMTYYISGPMTGIKEFNREAFRAAEANLRARGLSVITPFGALLPRGGMPYREMLAADLDDICFKAEALYMLKGWEHSPGSRAEHAVAVALELPIDYEGDPTKGKR